MIAEVNSIAYELRQQWAVDLMTVDGGCGRQRGGMMCVLLGAIAERSDAICALAR